MEMVLRKLDGCSHRRCIGLLMAVVALASASLGIAAESAPSLVGQTARRTSGRVVPSIPHYSTPEEQGMDSTTLAAGIDYLLANRETYRIHSVVVIRNDRVVLDARFYPFSREWRHDLASVTKSVTSTLIGIAIDQGLIAGVNARVAIGPL
jgi:CubicO group peptidase (beta-lactamase class C family)